MAQLFLLFKEVHLFLELLNLNLELVFLRVLYDAVKREIAQTLNDPAQVEHELAALIEAMR